ncbi:PAS domain S-box protein [Corallococcus sp. CA047B]|uniref:ATP-binding protein n=1 Tax=Corallococcus sp. CA047B TaxID=2316729 RepID=UPI000EA1976C|nr:ATP-binding protein [Corallococcus sp. CA047B]RKH13818.1 PAS domain S-box protein [Corallococcus sp. CA047B]
MMRRLRMPSPDSPEPRPGEASLGDEARAVHEVLAGGGDMGALMRSMDWSKTPLGPVKDWPQSLRTSVSTCLHSRFPMLVFWGPRLVKLYNDAYRPMLGGKHPQAMGRPGREVWTEIWPIIGPMLEQVRIDARATLSEDQLLFLERQGFTEECYFTFSYSPIRDETGGIGGVLDTAVETTHRVLDARRLRTLQELATRTTGSLRVHDARDRAMEALASNPADLPFALLYRLDEAGAGASLEAWMGLEADSPAGPARMIPRPGAPAPWPLPQGGRSGQAERVGGLAERFGVLPLREGVPPPDSALVLPMGGSGESDAAGLLVLGLSPRLSLDASYRSFLELVASGLGSAIASARTLEEARQRADALMEVDRAKTAFFSNVSHEFRTPLTLLLGPLEDVLTDAEHPLEPRQGERLELARRNGQRLLGLVNSLLDFSRLEAGRMQASFEPTDLAELTAGLATAFDALIAKAGMRLVVDCPPLPEPVWVDRELWEKVVLNLVSNAFKFTFEGEISVRLKWRGDRVELSVSDTGTGIPLAEVPRVFERFHRVEALRGRSHEGSGIGLALVQELVTLHGGTVRVESTEGRGSTFTVSLPTGTARLPLDLRRDRPRGIPRNATMEALVREASSWLPASPESSSSETSAPPREAPSTSGAPEGHVLLVDDSVDMRTYVLRSLEGRFTVEAVADGQAALAVARERPPDVVVSDVMMPGLDGFGLLRELKADARTAHVPVILLSARAGEEAKVEGLQAGADDYLVKPFGVRELVARLEGTVSGARARVQREHLLQALELSDTRYRLATRATKDAIWDWNLRTREITWSEGVQTLFGYASDAVRPESTWWSECIHPDDRDRVVNSIHAIIDAPGGSEWWSEYRFRRKDGTYALVEDRGWVVRDGAGRALRMVGAMHDVTERKSAEETLRRSEEEFRTLAEALPEAVFTAGPDGDITYVNDVLPRYTGTPAAGLLGDGYLDIIHPEQRDQAREAWATAQRERTLYQEEHRVLGRDGTHRWNLVRALPLKDAEGRVLKWVGTSTDIHELHEAQAQTQQRADFEQQLIGIVSHDLRNPVSAILLGSASLMRHEELDARSIKAVSRIQTAAERAHRMIRDLLDFTQSRLGGGIRIQRRPSDLHAVLHGVLEEIEATHPDREIHKRTTGDGHGEWDPDRLGQMAQNLVTNALKYSPRDTPVDITTWADDDSVTLSVHNQGTPIPPERLGRLFQPLQRASSDGDNSGRSIGLGLYIVKQLVEAHGGTVGVESTADAGTTFTVRLPRHAPGVPPGKVGNAL